MLILKKIFSKPWHCLLAVALIFVWLFQLIDGAGSWYAQRIYPFVGKFLNGLSSLAGFCVSDMFYLLLIVLLLLYPVTALFLLKLKKRRVLGRIAETVLWLYVWFYLGWGLNYYQPNFYQRTGIEPVAFSEAQLSAFIEEYVEALNAAYVPVNQISEEKIRQEVLQGYETIWQQTGMNRPFVKKPKVKTMIITPLASRVGVTGSMGPFFGEFTLNGDVLPVDYPATYAHELSHLLGIANEGEANFYAYLTCIRSEEKEIRFSGLLSIFHHVMNNAYVLLGENTYASIINKVRPEIRQLVHERSVYWQEKYSPTIGEIQNKLYDWYLHGNRVEGGRKSYSQIVGLILSTLSFSRP